ncbi:MAG: GTP-binding protein [Hyphomicrobiales bacterium]|nr:GTP-binding protein [Hyphomicrobiales bacterium]
MPAPVPFTVLGGYLGAGKTTLLNRILAAPGAGDMAVMVNDFGRLNIDAELVAAQGGRAVRLENGCVCCTIGDSLVESLMQVMAATPRPARILVEASGVADPARVADFARLSPSLRLDRVIVLVDLEQIRARCADRHVGDMALKQLAAADVLVLNKADLVDDAARTETRAWVEGRSAAVVTFEATRADVPLAALFAPSERAGQAPRDHDHNRNHDHPHDDFDAVRTWSFETRRVFDRARLEALLDGLPPAVLRAKGFVDLAGEGLMTLQLTGRRWTLEPAPDGVPRGQSRLVVLGTPGMPADADLRRLVTGAVTGSPAT